MGEPRWASLPGPPSVGSPLPDTLEAVSEWRIMVKFWAILDNTSHPLHESCVPWAAPSATGCTTHAALRSGSTDILSLQQSDSTKLD